MLNYTQFRDRLDCKDNYTKFNKLSKIISHDIDKNVSVNAGIVTFKSTPLLKVSIVVKSDFEFIAQRDYFLDEKKDMDKQLFGVYEDFLFAFIGKKNDKEK